MEIVVATTGGPLGLETLRALAVHHRIVAVVRPGARGPWWRRAVGRAVAIARSHPREIVTGWTRRAGIRHLTATSGSDSRLAEALHRMAPDLICIAGFPWLFSTELLAIPRGGVLNLHPSLLPRHRGPNPFFWKYYHDDRDTGVTVHQATARADAGPVVAQWGAPLARGMPVERLYLELAERGAQLFAGAVRDWEAGRSAPTPQDEAQASTAPRVAPGSAMVDFTWDAERVWHFLAGLNPRFREPLRDGRGRPIRYGGIAGFDRGRPGGPPGTAQPTDGGWTLWCRDGAVHLTRRTG
jgi:methionyl-tRNA formyltransferase